MELATKDGCSVEEAQRRYSMREFIEWAAFDRLRGIRIDRETMDALFANLCMYVIAPHTKKGGKAHTLKDFMLWKPKEAKQRSRKPIDPTKMNAWAAAFITQQTMIGNVKRA